MLFVFSVSLKQKMRLDTAMIRFFKQTINEKVPGSLIYLFGSRTNDSAFGGDIDLLVLSDTLVDKRIFRTIRIEFYKKFGWQKIDLVNFTHDDQSLFGQLIKSNAVIL